MKQNRIAYALIVALVGTVAFAGCKKKEEAVVVAPTPVEPAPAPIESAPAPATSYTATVGTAADPIVVAIRTDAAVPVAATLNAKLTYQDGQVAGDETTTVKAEDAGTTTVSFKKASAWPVGKYKVDVTVNGNPVGMTQEVEIK